MFWMAEGDWGGQIYFTVDQDMVKISNKQLVELVRELDTYAWDCNEGQGWDIRLMEIIKEEFDGIIPGGMGGGRYIPGELWVHKAFDPIKEHILQVLQGKLDKLSDKINIPPTELEKWQTAMRLLEE